MRCSHCRTPKRLDCFSGRHARAKTSHRLCNSCVGNGIKKPRFRRRVMAKIGCTIVDIDGDVGAKTMVNFSTTVCNCDSAKDTMDMSTATATPTSPPSPFSSRNSTVATGTDDESTTISWGDESEGFGCSCTPTQPTAQSTATPRANVSSSTIEQLSHALERGGSIKPQTDSLQMEFAFREPQPGQNEVVVSEGSVQVKTGSRHQSQAVTWQFCQSFAAKLVSIYPDVSETFVAEALFRATRPLELKVRLLGDTPSPTITTGRRSLSVRERGECWHRAFGDADYGKCPGCETVLSFDGSWHAAHLISNNNGGETCVANTTPSCGRCNDSMGSSNAPPSWYRTNTEHRHEPEWRGMSAVIKLDQ